MLRRINFRLFFALLLVGLVPTVYTTFRVFLLGQLPGEWSFSIAGQLSWVNLLYEVLNEAIILPLFFFLGTIRQNRDAFSNRVRTGLLICFAVYAVLSAFIIALTRPLLVAMATDDALIAPSVPYIRLEAIANLFSILAQFSLVALVTLNKRSYLYALTLARLVLCLGFDALFASALPFSLNLGVNGIALSNTLVNALLFAISVGLLARENVFVFRRAKLDFTWCKGLLRVGGVSGLESLVRNLAYMLMIARMVNMVNEQGTYWVANNFIWGWLLLPVLQLGELIKQEVAADPENVQKNTPGYLGITGGILVLWAVTIPLWKPFMAGVLGFSDVDKLFSLVLLLVGFYGLFAVQNVFDATFYGLGKTNYMLLQSVVTNAVYYGAAFVLYMAECWHPTLNGIALLFGIGTAFDSFVSFLAYLHLRKNSKRPIDKSPSYCYNTNAD